VHRLWINGCFKYFSHEDRRRSGQAHSVCAPSSVLSLEAHRTAARIRFACNGPSIHFGFDTRRRKKNVNVHRFEENINGRDYLIEVSSVGVDKWRAQIARLPGGSAALMPFYGKTPNEAAGQLSRWLAIAHGLKQR
jgi:hypothetical protein